MQANASFALTGLRCNVRFTTSGRFCQIVSSQRENYSFSVFGPLRNQRPFCFSGKPSDCFPFAKPHRFSRRTHLPFVPLEVFFYACYFWPMSDRLYSIQSRARIAAASARSPPRLAGTAGRALITPRLLPLTGACRALVAFAN